MGKQDVPYIGWSNTTLNAQPMLGEKIECPTCGEQHPVIVGETLQFYVCGQHTKLAGVNGRNVIGLKPDVSGKADMDEIQEIADTGGG